MVKAFDACPSQAEITAMGTFSKCISVPQVWRASWSRMWRTPAAFSVRAHRDVSACGLSASPASFTTMYPLAW